MYHELVPVPLRRWGSRLALVWLSLTCAALGCGDAHWATVRWPSEQPGAPRQPVFDASELGLAVRATSIAYEPDGVVVSLTISNAGPARLSIERAAIMLAWDELEYPVDAAERDSPESAWIELDPAASVDLRLRYHLGRSLTGPGSRLIFRSLTFDGAAVVDLPELPLPAMPI